MKQLAGILIPGILAVLAVVLLVVWTSTGPTGVLQARVSGLDGAPQNPHAAGENTGRPAERRAAGEPVRGPGVASKVAGSWPWFRGPDLDLIGKDPAVRLARKWPAEGPKRLWAVELGDGYAAPAISSGRVYILDHVHDAAMDLVRGLSEAQRTLLADTLAPLSTGSLDKAEPVLRQLFPVAGTAAAEGQTVSQGDYASLKQALGRLLSGDREKLLRALRENALEDIDASADTLRCLSLDDGKEIWRNGYRVFVPLNHGRSRTVPAVVGRYVISLGPQCHVACWDADTGKAHWLIDLVLDYGTKVPEWYAGQCPLVDPKTDRLVLAPSGKALLIAVDYKTGKVLWQCPNPRGWTMTHVSITPMDFAGRRMYVYCGSRGVAGVDAETGALLWDTLDWQGKMATCPSPLVVGPDRLFFSGGYNAGSLMLRLQQQGDRIVAQEVFRLSAKEFGAEQQTPVLFGNHLYGVRQHDKKLVCLDLNGKEVWSSGRDKFGSAPYMIADGLIYALNDEAWLTMAEATPAGYKPLARAEVIPEGHDSWGPMALVHGRLIVRDMTRMVCLDVAEGR